MVRLASGNAAMMMVQVTTRLHGFVMERKIIDLLEGDVKDDDIEALLSRQHVEAVTIRRPFDYTVEYKKVEPAHE